MACEKAANPEAEEEEKLRIQAEQGAARLENEDGAAYPCQCQRKIFPAKGWI